MTTVVDDALPGAEAPARPAGRRAWTSERLAAAVFVAYLVIAVPVLLRIGSAYWFSFGDDWGLILRPSGSLRDVLAPQHSHWSTVPILVFRGLYAVFGLRSYVPYQLPVILLHLGLAAQIRVVMRRVGVGPWVATLVASTYVLFGPGYQNYFSAVQISMMGSMVLGFGHLLLADHEGPLDRRDWLGLAAGALGLLCSGVGPVLVGVVALMVLIKRGWKLALFHTVPLALMYIVWYLAFRDQIGTVGQAPFGQFVAWVWSGAIGVGVAVGGYRVVALLLGILLVSGLALAWIPLRWSEWRAQAAAPLALLAGFVVLFAAAASERWFIGSDYAQASRYVDMGTAFALPALGVAFDAYVRRWRYSFIPIAVLLLVAVPSNANDFERSAFNDNFYRELERVVVDTAYAPFASQLPPDAQPKPHQFEAPGATMSFLLRAKAEGKLPDPPPQSPGEEADLRVQVGVQQGPFSGRLLTDPKCQNVTGSVPIALKRGDAIVLSSSPLLVLSDQNGQGVGAGIGFRPEGGTELHVVIDDVPVFVLPTDATNPNFTYCHG